MFGMMMETRCFLETRKVFLLLIFIIALNSIVSAIKISEVDVNPKGRDNAQDVFEWVELCSEDHISLEGYSLVTSRGKEYNLSGDFSGCYVVEKRLWLNNENEMVSLKFGNLTIDETPLLKDTLNDGRTWSLCNGEWAFGEGTKGMENSCGQDNIQDEQHELSQALPVQDVPSTDSLTTDESAPLKPSEPIKTISYSPQKSEKIILNSPEPSNVKPEREYTSDIELIKLSMIFSFILLCTVIVVIFIFRRPNPDRFLNPN